MGAIYFILVLLVCIILAFFVLIQNPEGGGLSSSIGGFNNQIMGVKQTRNVLERGTWLFVCILGFLCLVSVVIFSAKSSDINGAAPQQQSSMPVQGN